jgi:hypothetical protein
MRAVFRGDRRVREALVVALQFLGWLVLAAAAPVLGFVGTKMPAATVARWWDPRRRFIAAGEGGAGLVAAGLPIVAVAVVRLVGFRLLAAHLVSPGWWLRSRREPLLGQWPE